MLDDVASVTLSTALSALAARQRVSANNIANLETANFRAGQVSFEDNLRQAVAAGEPAQAGITLTTSTAPAGINGNNVSLDTETLIDEKTALQYQLLSGAVSSK
ncbi:flagellar basal body rod protein FlgB, partial [Jatrophihabitans sp.]|uniref:flagellar basal body rod protein FlgB n=1 Tax=Jatrophihabitans sp. TaxID=1932789 RepID=UPI0038CD8260